MNRRDLLRHAITVGPAVTFGSRLPALQSAPQKAAEAARLLGFRVVDVEGEGPAVMNIWRYLNESDGVMVGWIYGDGSTIWEGAMFGGLR